MRRDEKRQKKDIEISRVEQGGVEENKVEWRRIKWSGGE